MGDLADRGRAGADRRRSASAEPSRTEPSRDGVELLREVTARAPSPEAREDLGVATRWAAIAARDLAGDGRTLVAPRLALLRTAAGDGEQRQGPLPLH